MVVEVGDGERQSINDPVIKLLLAGQVAENLFLRKARHLHGILKHICRVCGPGHSQLWFCGAAAESYDLQVEIGSSTTIEAQFLFTAGLAQGQVTVVKKTKI